MAKFLKKIATLSVAYLVGASVAFAEGDVDGVREIGDGVYSFTIGEGNYSMFVVGDDSVAVFETFNSGHAAKLLEAVRSITDKPVKYAFISHNHRSEEHTSELQSH